MAGSVVESLAGPIFVILTVKPIMAKPIMAEPITKLTLTPLLQYSHPFA